MEKQAVTEGNSFSHFDPNFGTMIHHESLTDSDMFYLGHLTKDKALMYSPKTTELHQVPLANLGPSRKMKIEELEPEFDAIIQLINMAAEQIHTYSMTTANKATEFFSKKAVTRSGNPARSDGLEDKYPDELQTN